MLSLIYPDVCGICGKIDKNCLCNRCEKNLKDKLIYKIDEKENRYFETHIYLADYEGEIRDAILAYKFEDKSYMYKTFSKIILKNKKICGIIKSYDIIVSVPIHKERLKERGYNQSELIARDLAKNIMENQYKRVLRKIKNNERQSELKEKDRIKNVKNVYEICDKEIVKNKKIILFDDIYTTGSTVNECSKILKDNGAKEILVLTIAK